MRLTHCDWRLNVGLFLSLALAAACSDLTAPRPALRPILFAQLLPKWQLYRVGIDGTPAYPVSWLPGRLKLPAVSRDGRMLAYVNDSEGGGVFVTPLDSGPQQLVYPDTQADQLDWSPHGDQLVYALRTGSGGLRVISLADGTARDIAADLSDPAWSPDGRTILAAWGQSVRTRAPGIYRVTVGDTTARLFIAGPARTPAWSPDGGRVAVALGNYGKSFIYTMRADGSDRRQLTGADVGEFEAVTDLKPVWAPDGSWIAFQREHIVVEDGARIDRYDIYVVGLDGSGLRNLTEGAVWGGMWPTW